MNYEFDPAKDASNLDKHGLPLADAEGFEWESAVVHEDTRKQYAEQRLAANRTDWRSAACDDLLLAQ